MEVSSQLHTPAASPPGKETHFLLRRRFGGLDVLEKRKFSYVISEFRRGVSFRSSGMLHSTDWMLVTSRAKISEDILSPRGPSSPLPSVYTEYITPTA
jgi:hypothetical protein